MLKKEAESELTSRCLLKCSVDSLPESVNQIWRTTRSGKTYKTKKAAAWQAMMIYVMQNARTVSTYEGFVMMVLKITRRTKKHFDLDNRIKTVQDCLAPAGVILDDSQIVELHCYKQLGGEKDLCEVEVWKA